jgi:hypothetical protein
MNLAIAIGSWKQKVARSTTAAACGCSVGDVMMQGADLCGTKNPVD